MGGPKAIIIGSGPAGCAAACTLARNSIEATVYERGQPGKEKACGDALVASAVELFDRYGISQERIKSLGGIRFDRIDLYSQKSLLWQVRNTENCGWVISRALIDQEFRVVASKQSKIQFETVVTGVRTLADKSLRLSLRHKDGRKDTTTCDAVIIATGAMNQLSKKHEIDGKPLRALSISAYAKAKQIDALIFQFTDSCKPGYRWIFPMADGIVNLGVCLLKGTSGGHLKYLGEELLADYNATKIGRWRSGMGQLWSGKGYRWHHPSGVVSCGDAAGLVNPFNGEGITAALRSGERAGIAVSNYLLRNRDTVYLEEYSKWITEEFGRRYLSTPLGQVWEKLCGIRA